MATTLVIKGANFSANKIDTVIITDPIPCTGISFSAASANVDYGGTYTVSYTVTPADTTDAIEWSSDNADFAVNNGVVTIGAVGTATITAICGEYSATITLTSTATYDADDYDSADNMGLDYTSDYCSLIKGTDRYTLGRVSDTGYHTLWSDAETQAVGLTFCPAIIPPGSTSMKISYSASYATKVGFADMSQQSSVGYGAVKILDHDSSAVSAATRTIIIPSGVDGYYVSAYSSNTALLSIEFS